MKPGFIESTGDPGSTSTIPRFPVVLFHGVGVAAGRLNSRGFEPVASYLANRGIRAFAPSAPPYEPIAVRAEYRRDQALEVLRITGADRINIIGFSGGGFDARYLVSRLGGSEFVASVTTVSTPHRGTSLASLFLRSDRKVHGAVARFMKHVAEAGPWENPGDPYAALSELTPEHTRDILNPRLPDAAHVSYHSLAGCAGKGTEIPVSTPLRPMNAWLHRHEGPNDGFVSLESARWGTFWGTVPADHAELFGIRLGVRSFNYVGFYHSIVDRLAAAGL